MKNWPDVPALHIANRICRGLPLALFLLLAISPARGESTDAVKPMAAVLVLSESDGPYAEFVKALDKILTDGGQTHVAIDVANLNENPGLIRNSGLVIAVGMKAATAVAAGQSRFVLNVLIPQAGYEKLLRDFPLRAGSPNFSAIFLDQPVSRQVRLIAAMLPGRKDVGLLYSSPPDNLATIRSELAGHGLNLHLQSVKSERQLSVALQDVLKDSNVLLALPDAAVYNNSTILNILLETYRRNVPLIGISQGYVKAGALCAVISTPSQIAAQTATLISQFGDSHVLPAAQYPHEFEVLVNESVAHSLGLKIKSSSVLHAIISKDDRSQP